MRPSRAVKCDRATEVCVVIPAPVFLLQQAVGSWQLGNTVDEARRQVAGGTKQG
jgi:hypothetical protein